MVLGVEAYKSLLLRVDNSLSLNLPKSWSPYLQKIWGGEPCAWVSLLDSHESYEH